MKPSKTNFDRQGDEQRGSGRPLKNNYGRTKVAINGFGRIGRMTLRALLDKQAVEVVAINDLTDMGLLTHLFKYDTSHGKFPGTVIQKDSSIVVNGKPILLLSEKDPEKLPWSALDVDVVIESTGRFTERSKAQMHLNAGAKKVLITAPATGNVKTIVAGVNNDWITSADQILYRFLHDQLYRTAIIPVGKRIWHCLGLYEYHSCLYDGPDAAGWPAQGL